MGHATHYTLTMADIADLRASVRLRVRDHCGDIGSAYIQWIGVDHVFALHSDGHIQALSARLEVLATCLRQDRAEPGFIRRILDPAEDVRLASLDPAAANAERQRIFTETQRQNAARADRDAATTRRNTILPPIDVSGIDLFD